jgi:hypothetical protein
VDGGLLIGELLGNGSGFSLQPAGVAASPSPGIAVARWRRDFLRLVPGDVQAFYLGDSFSQDIAAAETHGVRLDKGRLERPVVQAMLKNLSGPYAFYRRGGADGQPDVGLVVELAADSGLALGDPTIETALPALLLFILEQPLPVEATFGSGAYGATPLRYVNIEGQHVAVDYTIVERRLLAATSKEGMLALLDTVAGKSPSVETHQRWQAHVSSWGRLPSGESFSGGAITYPALQQFLPDSTAAFTLGRQKTNGTATWLLSF